MRRDDRFYAFIIAHTSRSRSHIRRICVEKRALHLLAALVIFLFSCSLYGFYGLLQHVQHLRIESENNRLREENERQRLELNELNNRVEAVEDTSRRLAEKSGVVQEEIRQPGTGGPALPLDPDSIATLEQKTRRLELEFRAHEASLKLKGYVPSIWPVDGKLESGFGGRRNPFGGSGFEFHSGQDIEAPFGASIVAAATGTVAFVGWQNGYGQLVVIDHGGGLTTRYGHLSHIDVQQGQVVSRGEFIGKVGSTGRSTGPHLHYEIRINDEPVNPLQYLLSSTRH